MLGPPGAAPAKIWKVSLPDYCFFFKNETSTTSAGVQQDEAGFNRTTSSPPKVGILFNEWNASQAMPWGSTVQYLSDSA